MADPVGAHPNHRSARLSVRLGVYFTETSARLSTGVIELLMSYFP